MPVIISIGNQKGGVGKTTTAINLADAMGMEGHRVLVIDADPQGNTSSILLKNINLREERSLVHALEAPPEEARLSANACQTSNGKVDVVPNTGRCILWERSASNTPDSVFGLLRLIKNDREIQKYDYLVIDTPPNIGAMVNNSLMVSDYAIIPIPTSDQFALDGLAVFLRLLQSIRHQNHKLKLMGVVLTKYDDRAPVYSSNREKIISFFKKKGIHVFNTTVRYDVNIDVAQMKRKTILELSLESQGAQDYYALSKEVMRIVDNEKAR